MKTFILCLLVASAFAAPASKPQFKRGMNRIVGGTDVMPGELPYQLSFQDNSFGNNFHFCGASIYNEDTMICAGHCVYDENLDKPDRLNVVAGDNNLSVEEGTEQKAAVVKIILHEDFNSRTLVNDISLLKIENPFTFNEYVGPVPIPTQGQKFEGDAIVSGWGRLAQGGDLPTVLQKVSVPLVSDEVCRTEYGTENIDDSMVCAGDAGLDSCQGDSGGPMVCEGGILCGIVSWGHGCAQPNYAGVYTEVAYFVDWIKANA